MHSRLTPKAILDLVRAQLSDLLYVPVPLGASMMPWLAELRSRIRAEAIDKWGRNDAVDGALEMLFEIVTIELRSHGKFRLTGEPVEDQL